MAKRLQDAKDMIYTLSQSSEKDEVKLRASQDIVDRIDGKNYTEDRNEWGVEDRLR